MAIRPKQYVSLPKRVGKHNWRLVVGPHMEDQEARSWLEFSRAPGTGLLWLRGAGYGPGSWFPASDFPAYRRWADDAGIPQGARALFDAYQSDIDAIRASDAAAVASAADAVAKAVLRGDLDGVYAALADLPGYLVRRVLERCGFAPIRRKYGYYDVWDRAEILASVEPDLTASVDARTLPGDEARAAA